MHNLTTVDAPETVEYVKTIPGIKIKKAQWADGRHKTMWNLIPQKLMPPTRLARYCCEELKEHGGKGRLKITGVRKFESHNRSQNSGPIQIIGKPKTTQKYLEEHQTDYSLTPKGGVILNFDDSNSRRAVEHCFRTTTTLVNPIIYWTEEDVWEFLHHYGCESNPLYKCGYKRIGCIGCPMATAKGQRREFVRYPKYKELYIRAFDRMLEVRKEKGRATDWESGVEVMKWWLGDDPNQLSLFDDEY